MNLFRDVFNYEKPDEMLQVWHSLEPADYDQATFSIEDNYDSFSNVVINMPEGGIKNKGTEMLSIASKIFNFISKERKQKGQGLKIVAPNQMLSRLPISLAQLKAGNNSEKLKNEIRQFLHRSKKTYKTTL